MVELVRREFIVDIPLQHAWGRLACVETRSSWSKHIKSVQLQPTGPLTPTLEGIFRLAGGVRSTFRMEAFEPPRRWQWVGRFATVNVHYDHRFEPAEEGRARLTRVVEAEGPGAATLGRLFGAIYGHNLDRAIPNLPAELRSRPNAGA